MRPDENSLHRLNQDAFLYKGTKAQSLTKHTRMFGLYTMATTNPANAANTRNTMRQSAQESLFASIPDCSSLIWIDSIAFPIVSFSSLSTELLTVSESRGYEIFFSVDFIVKRFLILLLKDELIFLDVLILHIEIHIYKIYWKNI